MGFVCCTADTSGGAYDQWQVSNSDVGDKELALPVIRYENPNNVSTDKSLKGASGGHCKCEWIDKPMPCIAIMDFLLHAAVAMLGQSDETTSRCASEQSPLPPPLQLYSI
jgi:hypothetical protein